ncbi:hypothetical protein Nepgr_023984 [Nepenthes gracilis]|uniref:Uncharacterized protein n=1 Tax=Nepenthes gracilis TaxID=150966 RepID=A0AAD3Y012_NEPGR|nr:hypothetical protein Nepgr_023984 [Nepenthes gracilis]
MHRGARLPTTRVHHPSPGSSESKTGFSRWPSQGQRCSSSETREEHLDGAYRHTNRVYKSMDSLCSVLYAAKKWSTSLDHRNRQARMRGCFSEGYKQTTTAFLLNSKSRLGSAKAAGSRG